MTAMVLRFGREMFAITRSSVQAFFKITHGSLALLGVLVAFILVTLGTEPTLRNASEIHLRSLLQARQEAAAGMSIEPEAIDRATASNPKDLPKQQAALAYWLSRKYRVAPEPLSALVAEAFEAGEKANVDPTLILAVMAIESGFNPFAQSSVGAQGLMQVMTDVHTEKYHNFGGKLAAFDPLTNLRVGVRILKDCITSGGSVQAGLKRYVGATTEQDGGYADKVLAEQARLIQVASGQRIPLTTTVTLSSPNPAPSVLPVLLPQTPAAAESHEPVVAPEPENVAVLSHNSL